MSKPTALSKVSAVGFCMIKYIRSIDSVKALAVFPCDIAELLCIHISQFCDQAADMLHVQRFIAAASDRLRRKVRAVCLYHQSIQRYIFCHFLQIDRLFKCHRPREGNHTAQRQINFRALPTGRTAVNHATRQSLPMRA